MGLDQAMCEVNMQYPVAANQNIREDNRELWTLGRPGQANHDNRCGIV